MTFLPHYNASPEYSAEVLRKSIPLMIKNNVPPHPINYAVWYVYAAGYNGLFNKAINKALTNNELFDEQSGLALYKKYICNESEEAFEKMQLQLQTVIDETASTVEQSNAQVLSVSGNLEGSVLQLEELDNLSDAGSVLSGILEETKQFSAISQNLKVKLNEANEEMQELRNELVKAKEMATRDGLTGLLNRRAFDSEITDLVDHALDSNHCLLMLDLDHFKRVNDTYGHIVGDKVIRFMAGILKKYVAQDHLIARYGGEEMVVIMPNTEVNSALEVAETIRATLAKSELKQKDNGQSIGKVTVSIGVTTLQAADDVESFVARADKALYAAKTGGRNKVMQA